MTPFRSIAATALALLIQNGSARAAEPPAEGSAGHRAASAQAFTFACGSTGPCPAQAGPGAADRDVRPFEGTLGRPCGYRWRATPEGTRKVRVCF